MPQISLLEGFFLGIAGGAISEFYGLYNLRHTLHKEKPGWLTSWFYWTMTAGMVLLGGGTVCLYIGSGVSLNYWAAIQLGMSTPLLITAASKQKPKIN